MTIHLLFNKMLIGPGSRSEAQNAIGAILYPKHKSARDLSEDPDQTFTHYITQGGTTMEIIKKTENIKAGELYSMTKGPEVRKMQDAKGEVLDIMAYVIYKDDKDDGSEPVIVLSVKTTEGALYATNSKTFIRNFVDILAIYDECGEAQPILFKVGSARSNAGREYLTCTVGQ